jgi:hypothetical protein
LTDLFKGSSFKHIFQGGVSKGAFRILLQQGVSEFQAKLLQVLLRFALIADFNALQGLSRRYVSVLFAVELFQQEMAQLVFDTSNGVLAAESCLGAYMKV